MTSGMPRSGGQFTGKVYDAYGTLERSTDGTSWSSFSTSDRASGSAGDNTYIRYTPTATLNGKIRAVVHL